MFVCLLLMLAVALSATGVTVAFAADGEQSVSYDRVNYLTSDRTTFAEGVLSESTATFDTSSVKKMHTKASIGANSFEMKYTLTADSLSEWACQLFVLDDKFETGMPSWERTDSSAYLIWFNKDGFGIERMGNGGNISGNNSHSCTMTGEHTLAVDIETDEETTTAIISVKLDGEEIMKITDTAAANTEGGVTFINNAGQSTTAVSKFDVLMPRLPEPDEPLFDDSDIADSANKLVLGVNATKEQDAIKFAATGDAATVHSQDKYENLKLKTEINLDVSNAVQDDWYAFLAFADTTPGAVPWSGGKKRYILAFYKSRIELAKYNGTQSSPCGSAYSLPDDFYAVAHTYHVAVSAPEEGKLGIKVNIDSGRAEFDYTDSAPGELANAGGVTFITNAGNKITAEMSSFLTSEAAVSAPIESDFFEKNKDVAVTDFTSLLQSEVETTWTGTMNEAVFAGDVTFYKGGKKDNINLGGVNIVTVATKHDLTSKADFILNFKLTVNWGKRDGDWGTVITFRDNNAGAPMWDGSSENVSRKCYALRFDRNASNEDETTNGSMSIVRYENNATAIPVGEKTGVELNGKEIEYKVGIVNVDEDEDGTVDYVWICVTADGEVVLEYKDDTENKITENGGMMIIKHNTRTCTISGIAAGEACEEYVVGSSKPVDPVNPPDDKDPDDKDPDDDNKEPAETGKKKKCGCSGCGGSAGDVALPAAAVLIAIAGITLFVRKKTSH